MSVHPTVEYVVDFGGENNRLQVHHETTSTSSKVYYEASLHCNIWLTDSPSSISPILQSLQEARG